MIDETVATVVQAAATAAAILAGLNLEKILMIFVYLRQLKLIEKL